MINVLVNATGARCGGALSILNQFCVSKKDDEENFFYILSPVEPPVVPLNSRWIKFETHSLFTVVFALFGAVLFYYRHGCSRLISFSNINSFFPAKEKVTYFHNLHICFTQTLKYRLFRFALKHTGQKYAKLIFQTPYVHQSFSQMVFEPRLYKIAWPGILRSVAFESESSMQRKKQLLYVVSEISDANKNFSMVTSIASALSKYGFKIAVTVNDLPPDSGLIALGSLTNAEVVHHIRDSYGVLVCSEYESLCLPIFEGLQNNTPAFVLNRPYLRGLEAMFGEIPGLYRFETVEILSELIYCNRYQFFGLRREVYELSDWDF